MILIVCAVVFLVALYLLKNGSPFENTAAPKLSEANGLIYTDATVADLLSKDRDGDGVLDWEEALWGLDPDQKETTPGEPDGSVVAKLKAEQEIRADAEGEGVVADENLTETDKFSRELLSTIAVLNQNGAMDDITVEKISSSLAEHIKNSPQRKVYNISDLKIVKDDSRVAAKKFNDTLNAVYIKYPIDGDIIGILQRFIIDETTADPSVLLEFGPIIKQTRARLDAMVKVEVPEYFSLTYLELLNAGERVAENLEDIQLYETDPVVALGGITRYEENTTALGEVIVKLINTINQRL